MSIISRVDTVMVVNLYSATFLVFQTFLVDRETSVASKSMSMECVPSLKEWLSFGMLSLRP